MENQEINLNSEDKVIISSGNYTINVEELKELEKIES